MSVVKEEAKHLDSVTDHAQEQEFDQNAAMTAMTAMAASTSASGDGNDVTPSSTAPKKKSS